MCSIFYNYKKIIFNGIMVSAFALMPISVNAATIEKLRKLSMYTQDELEYCVTNILSGNGSCSKGLEELLANEDNPKEICEVEVPWFRKHELLVKGLITSTKRDIENLQKYKQEYKKIDWTVAVAHHNKPSFFAPEKVLHLITMITKLGVNEAKKAFVAVTGIQI